MAPVELPAPVVFPALAEFIQREELAAAEQRLERAEQELTKANKQPSSSDHNSPAYRLAEQTVVVLCGGIEVTAGVAMAGRHNPRYASPTAPPATDWEKLKRAALSAEYEAQLEEARLCSRQKRLNLSRALCRVR